jgi:hypothetical protein
MIPDTKLKSPDLHAIESKGEKYGFSLKGLVHEIEFRYCLTKIGSPWSKKETLLVFGFLRLPLHVELLYSFASLPAVKVKTYWRINICWIFLLNHILMLFNTTYGSMLRAPSYPLTHNSI